MSTTSPFAAENLKNVFGSYLASQEDTQQLAKVYNAMFENLIQEVGEISEVLLHNDPPYLHKIPVFPIVVGEVRWVVDIPELVDIDLLANSPHHPTKILLKHLDFTIKNNRIIFKKPTEGFWFARSAYFDRKYLQRGLGTLLKMKGPSTKNFRDFLVKVFSMITRETNSLTDYEELISLIFEVPYCKTQSTIKRIVQLDKRYLITDTEVFSDKSDSSWVFHEKDEIPAGSFLTNAITKTPDDNNVYRYLLDVDKIYDTLPLVNASIFNQIIPNNAKFNIDILDNIEPIEGDFAVLEFQNWSPFKPSTAQRNTDYLAELSDDHTRDYLMLPIVGNAIVVDETVRYGVNGLTYGSNVDSYIYAITGVQKGVYTNTVVFPEDKQLIRLDTGTLTYKF